MPMPDPKPLTPAGVITGHFAVPLLDARGLHYAPGGTALIRDVSVRVQAGRRLMILGANGAGKSLLLRLLHGLIAPASGQLIWQGDKKTRARAVPQALVFQKPVMLRRSVMANLTFALTVRGIVGPERARRAAEALALSGLEDLAYRPARVLSGGEQQRLAIARALACQPDLLFLDEPTASLDPAATARIEALIDAAHQRGVTIVMVTHDKGQARRLADDVLFLEAGQVGESGPASTLLSHPKSPGLKAWLDGQLYISP